MSRSAASLAASLRRRSGPVLLWLGVLLPITACGGPSLRSTRGYLVISIDTLRADHLSSYGYEKETSPFLDTLAARGIRFENAISPYPSTLTSHMSLFTGLYPEEHAVYPPDHSLSPALATLPEMFHAAGYRTAGFTEGGLMEGHFGFDRGFDRFSDEVDRTPRDLETTLDRGRAFLDDVSPDERFFLFLHTYAVHTPYDPVEPYDSEFWQQEPPANAPEPTGRNLLRLNRLGTRRADRWVDYYESQYDGSIAYVDAQLAAFFDELSRSGLLDDLTVVVLSDHGEEFLEHGLFAHSQIYDETMHVPLVILHPDLDRPGRVADLVGLPDVTATLIELAGLDPEHQISGHSLIPSLLEPDVRRSDEAFGEVALSRTLYRRDGDRLLQLVVTRHSEDEWLGKDVIFDLPPGETGFSIRSFEKPRRIRIHTGGPHAKRQWISPEWQRIELPAAVVADGVRVLVRADNCTPIHLQGQRCLSFQIRDPSPRRVELFDLSEERPGRTDISTREPRTTDQLLRRLSEYRFTNLAPPQIDPPDEELLEQLKTLGYVE